MMRPSEAASAATERRLGVSPDRLGERHATVRHIGTTGDMGGIMAAKKKATKSSSELIISKSRTKAAAKKCNVGSEFYGALDAAVRELIKNAEARATGNKRKTLKAVDL
jgi:hypothetical protein